MRIKIISAGAGSGKTYRLTQEMVDFLLGGDVRPEGILATTFTRKAAAELQERARLRLLEQGLTRQADALSHALIGTVHGMGVKLLQRFAYEAGVSPQVDIIAEEDHQVFFNQALAIVLSGQRVERMEALSLKFNHDPRFIDWRQEVRRLTEMARANAFSADDLAASARKSWASLAAFLDPAGEQEPAAMQSELDRLLRETIERLEQNADTTKKTAGVADDLKRLERDLRLHGHLPWAAWARLGKLDPGAKSRDDVAELMAFAQGHVADPRLHDDIRSFIHTLFELASDALQEYEAYKKRRGLIDYNDMEVLVNDLLDRPAVQEVLRGELDLLMVDEFQDTSPLQLEIFIKLSRLATHSVWVGDPKQSIYGFRGAEPALMQAVIQRVGGIGPDDILPYSWRSCREIVYTTNAIFTEAFKDLPREQVALELPDRYRDAPERGTAVRNWRLRFAGEGRKPGRPWNEHAIAEAVRQELDAGQCLLRPKGSQAWRPLQAGDIAILCRRNSECQLVAEALARAGLKAAIARAGLLQTAEAVLLRACLRYLLHRRDALAIAEILVLGEHWTTEEMVEHRLAFRQTTEAGPWAGDAPLIRKLDDLRDLAAELSSSEALDLLLDRLDLRRISVAWGRPEQRLDNLERLRRLALDYEASTARLHEASSLGGFLLWLDQLADDEKDMRASGEAPDAVNVLTYHASKGLEWPFVICHSLDARLRINPWGLDIVRERDEVELDDVLGHRWIRYWVNPYGSQERNTPLADRMRASPAYTLIEQQALDEEKRLLYVGITRARDYLAFANGLRGTPWLDRVAQRGEPAPMLPEKDSEPVWSWNDVAMPLESTTYSFDREWPSRDPDPEPLTYWEARSGRVEHAPYLLDPRSAKPDLQVSLEASRPYATDLPELEHSPARDAEHMLRAFFTALPPRADLAEAETLAARLLGRFLPQEAWEPSQLARSGIRFFDHLATAYPQLHLHRHVPLVAQAAAGRIELLGDMILEADDAIVLLQHSSFCGKADERRRHAQQRAFWLFYLGEAARQAFDKPIRHTCLHFARHGLVERVELQPTEAS